MSDCRLGFIAFPQSTDLQNEQMLLLIRTNSLIILFGYFILKTGFALKKTLCYDEAEGDFSKCQEKNVLKLF